ncbi:pentraxin-4-like isoform X2 [Clavelina lepadiformis]|uniref:pentraxin-4-like isoform X2 n=1 Tax=Clavelina lepadiformis TaxID=159417 RepID=UPI004042481E
MAILEIITVLLLSTALTTYAQDQEISSPQIPVCVPANSAGPNGGYLQRQKGDPGEKGDKGERGFPGYGQKSSSCPLISYHMRRLDQRTDYPRYRYYVPRMTQATACTWVETSDYNNHATLWHYATNLHNNEFFLAFLNPTTIRMAVGDILHDFQVESLTRFQRLHICGWFSSSRRQIGIFINTKSISTVSYRGEIMLGGGSLLLGQEQDRVNAQWLDASQSLSGTFTNMMIWPRVLSEDEISNIAYKCECPLDYAIALTLDRTELYGEATYSIPNACPTF